MIREFEKLELLNRRIDRLVDEYERLRARAISTGSLASAEGSGVQSDVADVKRRQDTRLAKLSDLSIHIDHLVDEYTAKRLELLEWITANEAGFTVLESAIIIAKYLEFKRFEEIARSLRVSRSTVYNTFASARAKLLPITYVAKGA